MPTVHSLLSKQAIFSCLDDAQKASVLEEGFWRRYQKGALIAQSGDVWQYLFLVTEGVIHAIKESSEGRSLMVAAFAPGDVFWGLAFFQEDAPMPVTLQAVKLSEIYLWPRERLLPILLKNGQMSWELARLMMQLMQRASLIVEELAFQPVAGRVARLLLEQAQDQDITPRSLTLDEMAARIGSTREMVCRAMQRFASEGLIEVTRTEFYITDRQGLGKLAEQGKG